MPDTLYPAFLLNKIKLLFTTITFHKKLEDHLGSKKKKAVPLSETA